MDQTFETIAKKWKKSLKPLLIAEGLLCLYILAFFLSAEPGHRMLAFSMCLGSYALESLKYLALYYFAYKKRGAFLLTLATFSTSGFLLFTIPMLFGGTLVLFSPGRLTLIEKLLGTLLIILSAFTILSMLFFVKRSIALLKINRLQKSALSTS